MKAFNCQDTNFPTLGIFVGAILDETLANFCLMIKVFVVFKENLAASKRCITAY